MRRLTRKDIVIASAALLGAAALGMMTLNKSIPALHAQDGGKSSAKKSSPKNDAHAADRAAIHKATERFIRAFDNADAKAVAAAWTENGEYVADDGTHLRGRENIEKDYAETFAKRKPNAKVKSEVDVESIRFPSKDTAIEEGYFKVHTGKEVAHSKYTILHVREGGQWLMAVVREWPSAGVSIRDLEWLIGTWSSKNGETEIKSSYEWWGDKTFLRAQLNIKTKNKTITGFQMIGKDASTGQIRSWAFDPDGSFGEASWSRDGKKWVLDAAAVLPHGGVVAQTNIMTRLDDDTFTFQSVQRTLDGESLPDVAPVRVYRTKAKE